MQMKRKKGRKLYQSKTKNNNENCKKSVCLGLTTKKIKVARSILHNNIDRCCIQEAEISLDFPAYELSINGFFIEAELEKFKIRLCIYVKMELTTKEELT
jgi:hypothetical protein